MAQDEIPQPPSVFDYADFRIYLGHWFDYKKRVNPRFSHRLFARLVGTRDPSVLAHVIAGRRDLPGPRVAEFCRVMELDETEAVYFGLLVRLGQARDDDERRRAWAAMANVRAELRGPTSNAVHSRRSWVLSAIGVLAECPGFRSDPVWIAETLDPPISAQEAAEALERMREVGLLVETPAGLRPADATRQSEPQTAIPFDETVQIESHRLLVRTVDRIQNEDPQLLWDTAFLHFSVAIPAGRVREFREVLFELQNQAMFAAEALGARITAEGPLAPPRESELPDADRVYFVNVTAFPVSRKIE